MQNELIVSVIIVCMNNLENLFPCLDSIKLNTFVSYETFVVAYLFSKENLQKLKENYPWVIIVESDEIRGFSENNNLALRQARGKYCFVLNDDTYFNSSVIDNLTKSFDELSDDVAVVSPNILNPDGTPQCCGRPPRTMVDFIFSQFRIFNTKKYKKYFNQKGVFQSYNILGAAFIVRTSIFAQIGFFDERYFFCPEDIAVSTLLNEIGYKCFVDTNIVLYHKGGTTKWSRLLPSTEPAGMKGEVILYARDSLIKKIVLMVSIFVSSAFFFLYYRFQSKVKEKEFYDVKAEAKLNTCKTVFKNKTPKEIFLYFNGF